MDYQAILSAERRADLSARGLWLNRLFSDALDDVAARTPDALAIVDHNSMTGAATRMSYAELQRLSVRLACALAAQGVQRGDVVAVQLPNWWHYAALYIACVRIGAVINPLMPVFRERELEYMLGFAEAKLWVVPREFRGFDYPAMAASLRGVLPKLEKVFVVGGADAASSFEAVLLEARAAVEGGLESFSDAQATGLGQSAGQALARLRKKHPGRVDSLHAELVAQARAVGGHAAQPNQAQTLASRFAKVVEGLEAADPLPGGGSVGGAGATTPAGSGDSSKPQGKAPGSETP